MNATERIIDAIIRREGDAYVDHSDDRGGPTKYGITLATLSDWRMGHASREDVRDLTEEEARHIYKVRYIVQPGFHQIPDPDLRELVVDTGVLHGPGWAARRLQEAVGVRVDGRVGPVTLRAVEATDPEALFNEFCIRRIRKAARIVARDIRQRLPPEQWGQASFLAGWIDRASGFLLK